MVELATCYDHISQMFQPTQAYNTAELDTATGSLMSYGSTYSV